MIIRKPENSNAAYITYENIEASNLVVHGVSTRLGGVSAGHLGSMNLSYSRNDDPENVRENYRIIADAIGFNPENIVMTDQTHTTNVKVITEDFADKGYMNPPKYKDIDGLITNVPGLVLTAYFADCVPLLFLDPVKKAIGVAHSGWRGTVGRIGANVVKMMTENYGTNPTDILAAIGPSICADCYEVSEDVAAEFRYAFDAAHHDRIIYPGKAPSKYQLNLWEACRITMIEAGILADNIEMPGICTCHNPEFLFSHRASHGNRGNLAAFMALK